MSISVLCSPTISVLCSSTIQHFVYLNIRIVLYSSARRTVILVTGYFVPVAVLEVHHTL